MGLNPGLKLTRKVIYRLSTTSQSMEWSLDPGPRTSTTPIVISQLTAVFQELLSALGLWIALGLSVCENSLPSTESSLDESLQELVTISHLSSLMHEREH